MHEKHYYFLCTLREPLPRTSTLTRGLQHYHLKTDHYQLMDIGIENEQFKRATLAYWPNIQA